MSFKIGQKVVCICSSGWMDFRTFKTVEGPNYNEIVTISGFDTNGWLFLKEYPSNDAEGYAPSEFKPLQLDYDFVSQILEKVKPLEVETI